MIDLPPTQLETVKRILKERVPECEVRAFGSRATWTAWDYSDLDLAVVGQGKLDWRTIETLKEDFEESDLPIRVDVLDWHAIAESFRKVIERGYVVVQEGASGWRKCRLGDVVELKRGYDLPRQNRHAGKVPVVSSSGPNGFHSEAKVKGPGVVTGRYGTLGQVFYVPEDFWPLNTTLYVRDFKGNDCRFVSYFLRGLNFLVYSDKAAVPGLNRNHLHQVEVEIPSDVDEQRAIAHILGTLDDKIELNRRMSETLEAQTAALFKSWFIDFAPVHAKAKGQDLNLPTEIAKLFPNRLVPSELGDIPKGWQVKSLDAIADFQNGLALQKHRPCDGEAELPVVKIAQLRSGQADGGEWASASITPESIIDDGDVVFSWSGSLMVKVWCGGRAALNQHLFKVTSEHFPKWFYLHSTLSHLRNFQHIARGKATTMGHIQRHHLSDSKCAVPDKALLSAADMAFSSLLARSTEATIESRTLATQRDALLPKLLSGEVRVNGARQENHFGSQEVASA